MSFVFYDTETTETNTAFDQIVQFGAVRADHELRELDRFEIRCRLLPYVAPSPGAMRVLRELGVEPTLVSHQPPNSSCKGHPSVHVEVKTAVGVHAAPEQRRHRPRSRVASWPAASADAPRPSARTAMWLCSMA